ncbi:hypothetical protein [Endozoicomonas elysicola]|uniref:Uncharacterized protein n=1 Tax=Endozoicomonas elysicola TaxID=305900 RepID=A0A081K8W7_9GAMM|nr:hypothetical protein [Endozoicomonas elysicola]KEI70593.1 hypothetical protein GV64_07435 [Endozoicomonas elysicola]
MPDTSQLINSRAQPIPVSEINWAVRNLEDSYNGQLSTGQRVNHPPKDRAITRTIIVASSAYEENMEGFIKALRDRGCRTLFLSLPYNDLDANGEKIIRNVKKENPDMQLILCHSIFNRRFAITDVPDALYNKFLPVAARILGKENVGVIVHDFESQSSELHATLKAMPNTQKTTFEASAFVELTNRLDNKSTNESINRAVDAVFTNMLSRPYVEQTSTLTTKATGSKNSLLAWFLSGIKSFFSGIINFLQWLFTWPWRK